MANRAVLIGCNYPGTKMELKGCVNDVRQMYLCLVETYGFSEDDITVLIDMDDSYPDPNGRVIRDALDNLVKSAEPGDFLFVHYSGHGTRLPAETGDDDDTGYDECIVPTDMNLITDDDFRDLVDQVLEGCQITIVSDSCHSGGLIDEAKEQIGESFKENREEEEENSESGSGFKSRGMYSSEDEGENESEEYAYMKDKSLPLSLFMEVLQEKTGNDGIDIGKLRPILFDVFGDDASPKVKKFMNLILNKLQDDCNDGFSGMSLTQQFMKHKLEEHDEAYVKSAMKYHIGAKQEAYAGSTKTTWLPDTGILISGCQTNQTSTDFSPTGEESEAYGALSNCIQTIIKETCGQVSNKEMVLKARKMLKKQRFKQRPGLYCCDDHVDAPFICY